MVFVKENNHGKIRSPLDYKVMLLHVPLILIQGKHKQYIYPDFFIYRSHY